jgi:hypothetical protein
MNREIRGGAFPVEEGTMALEIARRPYLISFGHGWGDTYPLTAEDVDRLAAEYPLIGYSANRLLLRADDGRTVEIRPATLGGGRSFVMHRTRP